MTIEEEKESGRGRKDGRNETGSDGREIGSKGEVFSLRNIFDSRNNSDSRNISMKAS